jgi:hypothetical protein
MKREGDLHVDSWSNESRERDVGRVWLDLGDMEAPGSMSIPDSFESAIQLEWRVGSIRVD